MDAELLELQRQFESAQQVKSSVRLSDRNVVELVQKLQDLRVIDFDLLYTVSGKEYITQDQLKLEMLMEVKKSGRVSLIDLSDIIGVDLYHVERQAHQVVTDDPSLMLIQGEIISQYYWNSVAEEINEKLQECSQIGLADLAAQLQISSELVLSVLEPRLGTLVKGRLEGGQLYTPAYVARINAMVRGAIRGVTVPTNLPSAWNSLQQLLQEMNGATGASVEGTMFQAQFSEMVKGGEILGSLRAGIQWTPAVFAHAQKESVDSFFSQNSFISYDVLYKLAIPQPKQYLQSRYPEGIPLNNVFVHPSMVDMIDAAIDDAVENGNWIDSLSVLPADLSSQDASKLLIQCSSVMNALKYSKVVIMGESCVFSSAFIKTMFQKLEKELDTLSYTSSAGPGRSSDMDQSHDCKDHSDTGHGCEYVGGDDSGAGKNVSQKGSKKKKGKVTGPAKASVADTDPDILENLTAKSKKSQRKNRDTTSATVSDVKGGAKKGPGKAEEENSNIPSEEWVLQHILALFPDLEDLGYAALEDPREILKHLSSHLRPMLLSSWKSKRNTLLLESADRRRRLLDNLQKRLDEAYLDLQLYEKALDLFEDDPPTSNILHKHLLKTTAASIVDAVLLTLDADNKLMNGISIDEPFILDQESRSLNSGDRIALAKRLPGSLSVKAQALAEVLEAKRVDSFTVALKGVTDESGLLLKKLDKKLERTLLHNYRKDLISQVSKENDPVAFLPKLLALLYLQLYNKALQAPGRSISAALSRLKEKLPDSTYKVLVDYHMATVTLLALLSAATEDEQDCTTDRILTKRELLESKMPELKTLLLNTSDS